MPKLDGLGTVVDFLNDLTTPKIAAQIAKKVLGLAVAPLPPDSRQLHGYLDFRRVDCGEFRIIYRYRKQEDVVEVIFVYFFSHSTEIIRSPYNTLITSTIFVIYFVIKLSNFSLF